MTGDHEVPAADSRETVVLLHGLGLGAWAMKRIEWAFERDGYRVINVSYPSRTVPLERLASVWLPDLLRSHDTAAASRIHFVTHSMGGIVVRAFLDELERVPANVGRIVMIAPPHAGSRVVDRVKTWWLFRFLTGVNGRRLGTEADSFLKTLGPWNPSLELGIIASDQQH